MQGLRKRKSSSSSLTAVVVAVFEEWKRNKRLFCLITIAISLWSVSKVYLGNALNANAISFSTTSSSSASLEGRGYTVAIKQQVASALVGSAPGTRQVDDKTSSTGTRIQDGDKLPPQSAAVAAVAATRTTSTTTLWPPPQILQRIAVDNTIIVISTNCGYLEMAQNWILHAQKLKITNYLVIAQDETVYNVLKEYISHGHDHVVLLNRSVHKGTNTTEKSATSAQSTTTTSRKAFGFRSAGFYDICKQRPYMIESILQQGYNTLYSDIDLVWIRNVFQKIQSIRSSSNVPLDYIGMTEIPGIGDELDPNIVINEYEKMNNMCSALLYFQSNNSNVTSLINTWNQGMIEDTKSTGEDQTHLQRALRTLYGNYTSYWLDTMEFPPGFMYFNDIRKGRKGHSIKKLSSHQKQDHVHAVHANWMKGYQTKIDHLRKAGHWLVTDENKLSC